MDGRKNIFYKQAKAYGDVLRTVLLKSMNFKDETNPYLSSVLNTKKTEGCRRALLCPLRGSMTVEASLVTPIFFITVFSLFYVFQVLSGMLHLQGQLRDAAREYACYGTKLNAVQTLVKDKKAVCFKNIDNGQAAGAGGGSEEACYIDYRVRVPFISEKFFSLHLYQQMVVSKYEGKSMIPSDEVYDEEYVYITSTGRVCHKSAMCTYLKPSIRKVASAEAGGKRNVSGGKYYACDRCCRGKGLSDFNYVFITSYGECFHSEKTCSGLKRIVRRVKKSETGLPYCSKCGRQ